MVAQRKKKNLGMVSDVDIRLMRVFLKVVECGGLSAAQSELGVGRSTISRQLADLEIRMGFTLCERGRSGFRLTQMGQQAELHMRQLLAAADEFSDNIASLHESLIGTLNIGVIDFCLGHPENPLMQAITKFNAIAPKVSINLKVQAPNDIERAVFDGRLHIGLVPEYQNLPELTYMRLFDERAALFAGGGHPLARAVAEGVPFSESEVYQHLLIYRGYSENTMLRDIKGRFPRGSTSKETEAVIALVQAGIYLGFMPAHIATTTHTDLHEILPDLFSYAVPISAICRKNRRHSMLLQEFLKLLTHVRDR